MVSAFYNTDFNQFKTNIFEYKTKCTFIPTYI